MRALDLAVTALCLLATGLGILRWLFVAQREGWERGAATRWAVRWWTLDLNPVVAAVALLSLVVAPIFRPSALTAGLAVVVGPFGLPLRGRRPGPLVWTRRARRVAMIAAAIVLSICGAGLLLGTATSAVFAGLLGVLSPVIVDLAALGAGGPDPAEGIISTGPDVDVALASLAAGSIEARRVLVSAGPPGVAGEELAERATAVATHLLLVGRSGRRSWQRGAARGVTGCTIVLCPDLDHATTWVDSETEESDLVVWLTMPPDHVP